MPSINLYLFDDFSGVFFWQQSAAPGRYAGKSRRAQVAYIHYPGSDTNERVSGGKLHTELEITIASTQAGLDAMEDLLDTTGTLNCHLGGVTASLDYVQNRIDTFDGFDDSGTMVCGFTIV